MKTESSNITFDTAPSGPLNNGGSTPVAFASPSTPKMSKFLFNSSSMIITSLYD